MTQFFAKVETPIFGLFWKHFAQIWANYIIPETSCTVTFKRLWTPSLMQNKIEKTNEPMCRINSEKNV